MGDVTLTGSMIVISDEMISNDSLDSLVINERSRSIIRRLSRNDLVPYTSQAKGKRDLKIGGLGR